MFIYFEKKKKMTFYKLNGLLPWKLMKILKKNVTVNYQFLVLYSDI